MACVRWPGIAASCRSGGRAGTWNRGQYGGAISPPDFVEHRQQNTVFANLSALAQIDLTLTGSGGAERLPAAGVSAGFFETLGVNPALGRAFLPADEQTGWPQSAILSDGLWRRRDSISRKMPRSGSRFL